MTERNNRELKELDSRELDTVCGGFADDAGCIGPWIVNGRITTRQPSGENPWLAGGVYHH